MADDFRLLRDFLCHVVAVVALVHQHGRSLGETHGSLHGAVLTVEDLDRSAREHRPVAVFQIGDPVGEWRQCDGIGAKEHLAVAVAYGERAALAGADQEIALALEQDGESEGALEPRQDGLNGLSRRLSPLALAREQVSHHLRVGLGCKDMPVRNELILERTKVLDDAVVDDDDIACHVRMGIGFGRGAMGGPAGMADACSAEQRLGRQPRLEIAELARCTAASDLAGLERRHTRRVVAAVLEPLQRLDDMKSDRFLAEYADDATHAVTSPWLAFLARFMSL